MLYELGGAYVDIDCRCTSKNFLRDLEGYGLVTCIDVLPTLIYQGFLFANRPKHEFFRKCLDYIWYNFHNGLHRNDVFSFSGPSLAAKCILPYANHSDYIFKEGKKGTLLLPHYRRGSEDWVELNGKKVINCQEIVQGKRISGDYGIIWN